jgi:hypothetical protein
MSTRPAFTFLSTAARLSGAEADPLPAALLCGTGTSREEVPADDPGSRAPNATVTPAPMLAASAATAM